MVGVAGFGAIRAGKVSSRSSIVLPHFKLAALTQTADSPTGGYWLAASDGGVFTYGNAQFYGSLGDKPLASPIVGIVPTSTGHGYWLVAQDGGVFPFGDAVLYGSRAGKHLNGPVVGIASAYAATAIPGPPGPAGPAGAKGAAGAAGAAGATGPAGPAGATGAAGATGPAGAAGAKGDTGTAGAAGPTGLKGETGAAGAQGAGGPQGPAGPASLSALEGTVCQVGGLPGTVKVTTDTSSGVVSITCVVDPVVVTVDNGSIRNININHNENVPNPKPTTSCQDASSCGDSSFSQGDFVQIQLSNLSPFTYVCPGALPTAAMPMVIGPVTNYSGGCQTLTLSGAYHVTVHLG
jgi:hypothetical protein